ncbi:type IV pilin protein [Candidatus Avelusimicrobium fimicolum]|uniref:type IV pilin protein n=1 Tax=Candidatus Avelusimicrobium fimicolum TaxID=3416216 RepID=UPI003D0D47FD
MKKGFTLIELLIVMVIVGVLVTVSLPKYRASMERGRATEGINNVRAISDAVNAKYVMNENSYSLAGLTDSNGNVTGVDMTKSVNFSTPKMTLSSDSKVTVTTTRTGSYTLTATNQNGELISIECTGDSETCQNIGMEKNSSGKYVLPL